ncbi:MAG: hypothetical protein HYV07_31790 [Deltaproteobacteria bacterium]|nr:hypothetical protein [Deltaproteobacteria bacterium]
MPNGSIEVLRIRGVPIRLHFSLPIGAFVITRFELRPVMWIVFALLVLVHELGHAFLVKRNGLSVEHVLLHGFGGECAYSGYATEWQASVIAWGGVLAQAIVLVAVLPFRPWLETQPHGYEVAGALVGSNLWMIGFNLLPYPPLDGSKAWPLFRMIRDRRRRISAPPRKTIEAPTTPEERDPEELTAVPPNLDLSSDDLSDDDPVLLKKLVRGVDFAQREKTPKKR